MDPNKCPFNNRPTNPTNIETYTPKSDPNAAPITSVAPQQTLTSLTNLYTQQVTPEEADYTQKLRKRITSCFSIGVIATVITILISVGLATGFLTSNQGFGITATLLMGSFYHLIWYVGIFLCVFALVSTFIAKRRYHIRINKSLLAIIVSAIMINSPYIILQVLRFTALSQL